ncbi:hypothetical protein ZWY2020_003114 [Hordeum vulgare]|nr:hypothetical protein ZWY2020_003114 [Hordeum vulgare]
MDDLSSRVEMAESNTAAGKMANGEASDDNGRAIEVVGGEDTLPVVLHNFVDGVWPPPGNGGDPLLQRLRVASCEAAPRLWDASRNSACDLFPWTKQGSGLRSILVISGMLVCVTLTGLSKVIIFFVLKMLSLTNIDFVVVVKEKSMFCPSISLSKPSAPVALSSLVSFSLAGGARP